MPESDVLLAASRPKTGSSRQHIAVIWIGESKHEDAVGNARTPHSGTADNISAAVKIERTIYDKERNMIFGATTSVPSLNIYNPSKEKKGDNQKESAAVCLKTTDPSH